MDFNQAYSAIVSASIEQDSKEIPLLLSSTDFKDKECLEIGAGPLARLAVKLLHSKNPSKHITCVDTYNYEKINHIARAEGLEHSISVVKPKDSLKLDFKDNRFDIIYAGWIPSDLLQNTAYLDELRRACRRDIIFIMSGIKGDIPPMRDLIIGGNEIEKRKELKNFLTHYFKDSGYSVDTTLQTTLRLDFENLDRIFNTFHFFDFKNTLAFPDQQKLMKYLSDKVHDFEDNLYIFHAWK